MNVLENQQINFTSLGSSTRPAFQQISAFITSGSRTCVEYFRACCSESLSASCWRIKHEESQFPLDIRFIFA